MSQPLRQLPDPAPDTPTRRLPGQRYAVVMDDGTEFEVLVQNRDRVSWDRTAARHKWPAYGDAPFLATTFVAWCAAKRAGHVDCRFEEFEATAAEITPLAEDEADEARPTRPAHEPA